jgi:DNA-directed RNA polymerase subunit E'/Rpb7
MFRPFIGEVIVGKIEHCDEFGLQGYFVIILFTGLMIR